MHGKVGANRYHTTLAPGTPVHPIYESAVYAAAAFSGQDPARHERATQILETLLPLQETDPSSDWRGIWPWFAEERVRSMAPPDRNFADFIAVPLIQIFRTGRLNGELRTRISTALTLAAGAIRQRQVRLSYTNIAIMGIYVCVTAGEILNDKSLLEHGRQRLRQFVNFTRESQGFPEYNSPTYTAISLVELTRMLLDFSAGEDLRMVREVHDLAWQEIARHWHAPSGEWGGPHGRSYSTLLGPDTRAFLEKGTRGVVADGLELRLDWAMLPIRCPNELLEYFSDFSPRAHHVSLASTGTEFFHRHTHHQPEFTIGSVERGTFWNQSRSLIAYAPGEDGPAAFAIRFLHDHYDFCAANLLCSQDGANVLGAICLACDGGDKHPELDRFPNQEISASDWRVRLELFNVAQDAICELDGRWVVDFGTAARIEFVWIETIFGTLEAWTEISSDENRTIIDLVFYEGSERNFRFDDNFTCALSFAMRVTPTKDSRDWSSPLVSPNKSFRTLQWTTEENSSLELQALTVPRKESDIRQFAQERNATKHRAT